MHEVDSLVAQIAQASVEQSQGIAQVNEAVASIDQTIQETAGTAANCSQAAQGLIADATLLTKAVAQLTSLAGGGAMNRTKSESVPPEAGKQTDSAKRSNHRVESDLRAVPHAQATPATKEF